MPYCRKCGTQLAEDILYCYNCGTPVNIPTQPAAVTPITQQPSTQIISSHKPVYKDSLFILILSTLIITIIALIIVATLMPFNLDINSQNVFESPGINRANLNIEKLVNLATRI